jgi:hypothetical protein
MVLEIFRRVATTNRVFAEIGAGNGSENNTAYFLSIGWTGFWIDGRPQLEQRVQARPDLSNAVSALSSFVTRENVCELFKRLGVPIEFDLLSLDVDQNTFYIWEALGLYRPRVVVLEYNGAIPPDVDWKVHYSATRTWDGSHNFGASLKAYELLGRKLGYSLVGCDLTGTNAFFVRQELATPEKFKAPFTAENHYEPPRYHLRYRRGHRAEILDRVGKS